MAESSLPDEVSIGDLAVLFGVSTRQVRNLLEEAGVKSAGRGHWPLAASVRGVLSTARKSREPNDLGVAKVRAAKAKAEGLERLNAERMRDLVPSDDAAAAIDHVVAACAEAFAALPAMLTRDTQERARIEIVIKRAQGEVAKRLAEAARLLEEGGELPDAA